MTPRSAWLQALLPLAAPVPVAALAAVAGVLSTNAMVAVAIAAAICLTGRSAVELLRAQHHRDDADRWIVSHGGARPDDDLIEARIHELVALRTRTTLASTLRRIAVETVTPSQIYRTPVSVNRRNLTAHVDELLEIAHDLEDVEHPVSPRGVALAHRLVTEVGSPLYVPARARELTVRLAQTRAAMR
jgi:type III secretion system FlhB-like substrate exporter